MISPTIAGPSATGRGAEIRYEATFVAIPADRQARPARVRPDGFGGLQSMTVTGASESGQEKANRLECVHRAT